MTFFFFFLRCPLEFQLDILLELQPNLLQTHIYSYIKSTVFNYDLIFLFLVHKWKLSNKNNNWHISNLPYATGLIWSRQAHENTHSTCLKTQTGLFFIFFYEAFFKLVLPEGHRICEHTVSCPVKPHRGVKFRLYVYGTVCVTAGVPCSSQEIWNRSLHLRTVAPGRGMGASQRLMSPKNNYSGTAPWGAAALWRETSQ